MAMIRIVSDVASWRCRAALAVLLAAAPLSGCAVVPRLVPVYGEITNFEDPECFRSFSDQLASALVQQGETPEDAASAAARVARMARALPHQSQPMFAASASGILYGGYLEPRKSGVCVLRMYQRRNGDAITENIFSFFATRRLTSCICSWNVYHKSETD